MEEATAGRRTDKLCADRLRRWHHDSATGQSTHDRLHQHGHIVFLYRCDQPYANRTLFLHRRIIVVGTYPRKPKSSYLIACAV